MTALGSERVGSDLLHACRYCSAARPVYLLTASRGCGGSYSVKISLHNATHTSQMYTLGPDTRRRLAVRGLPQNEQASPVTLPRGPRRPRGLAKPCRAACLDTPMRAPISVHERPASRA